MFAEKDINDLCRMTTEIHLADSLSANYLFPTVPHPAKSVEIPGFRFAAGVRKRHEIPLNPGSVSGLGLGAITPSPCAPGN